MKLDGHVIIGTIDVVHHWFSQSKVFDIKKIRVFVLDQADMMIDIRGHQDDCVRIHKYVLRIDLIFVVLFTHSLITNFFYTENYHRTVI